MQTKIYKEDSGIQFGQWTDKTSKLMYYDSTVSILSKINTNVLVADYGQWSFLKVSQISWTRKKKLKLV